MINIIRNLYSNVDSVDNMNTNIQNVGNELVSNLNVEIMAILPKIDPNKEYSFKITNIRNVYHLNFWNMDKTQIVISTLTELMSKTQNENVIINTMLSPYLKAVCGTRYSDTMSYSEIMKCVADSISIKSQDSVKIPGTVLVDILKATPSMMKMAISMAHELNEQYKVVKSQVPQCNTCVFAIDRIYIIIMMIISVLLSRKSLITDRIINDIRKLDTVVISESVEEDTEMYVKQLESMIKEIREFYEKDENVYKSFIVPRKKHLDKMKEYMKGALERKYTLRIPIYKAINASEEVKDKVENNFIGKLKKIVVKYPSFVVLSPNWGEDEDLYVYITLKEPFGSSPSDKDDREKQSVKDIEKKGDLMVEAILTPWKRRSLPNESFGVPELRKYPLNDERHIKQAIKTFHHCKGEFKKELAKNIGKAVKEQGLEGKVLVQRKNPFAHYFDDFMFPEYYKDKKDKKKDKKSITESIILTDRFGKLL